MILNSRSEVSELYKVTIQKRGNSLGHNLSLWRRENEDVSKRELLSLIDNFLGGRAAEEVVFGNDCVTTGGTNQEYPMTWSRPPKSPRQW